MNVLICDDNLDILESIALLVEDIFSDVQVLKAHNGYDAIEKISELKNQLDLIISDNSMPLKGESTIDGITLLKFCRETGKNIPFLLVSGDRSTEFFHLRDKYKDYEFMSKPYRSDQLSETILKLLNLSVKMSSSI